MNIFVQACTLPLEHVAAFFDAVLGYYQVAAIALTAWTLSAWVFSLVFPYEKDIPYWLGTNVVFSYTGWEGGRRSSAPLDMVVGTLVLGFVPYLNVVMLAFMVALNAIVMYRVVREERSYA